MITKRNKNWLRHLDQKSLGNYYSMIWGQASIISIVISDTYGLAYIRVAQGRLRAAVETYERALQNVM